MSSLARQTSILIICRLLNYIVLFITPVILVRMISVQNFGQYKEFMLYAGGIINFAGFSVNKSLLYFISKYNDNKKFIFNTIVMNIVITFFVVTIILIFKELIREKLSYDFVFPLVLYLILLLNLDYCESYWIAIKKTDYVLYYNTFRTLLRSIGIVWASVFFDKVIYIVYSLLCIECLRFIFVFIYSIKKNIFVFHYNFSNLKEQLMYIFPMGFSNFIFYFNKELSKFFILYSLGIEHLALYSIGSYQVPIVGIVRGSIGDVIFSEVCGRCKKNKESALELWKKTNVLYYAIIFPVFIVFFYFSKDFILVCFTEKYIESIIIFKIYMLLILKECFETGIPIRTLNKNKFYVYGNLIALFLNIILMIILSRFFVFAGPAIAYVISDTIIYVYFSVKILSLYNIDIKELFYWKKIYLISISGIVILPILFLDNFLTISIIAKDIIISSIFIIIYFNIIIRLNISEINFVYNIIRKKIVVYIKKYACI